MVFDALTLWIYLNWRIIHPIRELTMAAEEIGVGNLDIGIGEARVEDEIGVLGRTFRRMRSNLKYSQTKLEQVNASLEQQILERTAAIRKLQGIQKELELANKRIIDADDNSRFLLTTYIHDEILVPLDELNERARLSGDSRLVELTRQVDFRLRKVRYDLSVPVIQDMRVELRRLLQETLPLIYPEGHKVKLFLNLSALNHVQELEPACSVLLYRFVRGAVSNVYRHAHAQQLWVKSAYDGKRLTLSVLDDGVGFNPVQVEQYIDQGHYFFHDIRIRAMQLGGEMIIQSRPGEGVYLEIVIPILTLVSSTDFKNETRTSGKGNRRARQ
jgi:two-component system NarL family sensor kinase